MLIRNAPRFIRLNCSRPNIPRVVSANGTWIEMKSDRASSSSKRSGSTPSGGSPVAGSYDTTRIPNPSAFGTRVRPILPNPTMPSVRPRSRCIRSPFWRSYTPALMFRS